MSKIRKSARGETCTFGIPGVCNHDPETVVLCHAPHPDKGMGKKGPDTWAAYGCSACHDAMDGRGKIYFKHKGNPYLSVDEYKEFEWHRAIRETQRRLIKKGLLPA